MSRAPACTHFRSGICDNYATCPFSPALSCTGSHTVANRIGAEPFRHPELTGRFMAQHPGSGLPVPSPASLLFASSVVALRMLLLHFVRGHNDEGRKRNGQQRDGRNSVQLIEPILIDVAIEQRQTREHKENVRAEDLQRSLAQGQKRLDRHQFDEVLPRPSRQRGERHQVDRRASGPICHLSSFRPSACWVRCGPSQLNRMPMKNRQAAAARAASHPGTRRNISVCVADLAPNHKPTIHTPCHANRLKAPALLEGDLQVGDMHHPVMHHVAQPKLRQQPYQPAGRKNPFPSPAHRRATGPWA